VRHVERGAWRLAGREGRRRRRAEEIERPVWEEDSTAAAAWNGLSPAFGSWRSRELARDEHEEREDHQHARAVAQEHAPGPRRLGCEFLPQEPKPDGHRPSDRLERHGRGHRQFRVHVCRDGGTEFADTSAQPGRLRGRPTAAAALRRGAVLLLVHGFMAMASRSAAAANRSAEPESRSAAELGSGPASACGSGWPWVRRSVSGWGPVKPSGTRSGSGSGYAWRRTCRRRSRTTAGAWLG
jgi:hypothetical protein